MDTFSLVNFQKCAMTWSPGQAPVLKIQDYLPLIDKERFSTGVFVANWDFGTKWTVKPLVVL